MGSCRESEAPVIFEPTPTREVLFTDIEIEVVRGKCARFLLLAEQRPVEALGAKPELIVVHRCTTLIELVPMMIGKTVFALARYWGKRVTGQVERMLH